MYHQHGQSTLDIAGMPGIYTQTQPVQHSLTFIIVYVQVVDMQENVAEYFDSYKGNNPQSWENIR